MERENNYLVQAAQARKRFLSYDQGRLIRKLKLKYDDTYLYTVMLFQPYRIHRSTGDVERLEKDSWVDANTFAEVMTLLDLVCDSREDRFLACRWKNMNAFGLMFHQNLLEGAKDPWAEKFDKNPEGFRRACLALHGQPIPQGDVAYAIELFDGLCIGVQLWLGDEEFPPSLRFLWDENATMYIRYETMYYARGMLLQLLEENMGN